MVGTSSGRHTPSPTIACIACLPLTTIPHPSRCEFCQVTHPTNLRCLVDEMIGQTEVRGVSVGAGPSTCSLGSCHSTTELRRDGAEMSGGGAGRHPRDRLPPCQPAPLSRVFLWMIPFFMMMLNLCSGSATRSIFSSGFPSTTRMSARAPFAITPSLPG